MTEMFDLSNYMKVSNVFWLSFINIYLHQDEHLPGQSGSLVLAQAPLHAPTQKERLGWYWGESFLERSTPGFKIGSAGWFPNVYFL